MFPQVERLPRRIKARFDDVNNEGDEFTTVVLVLSTLLSRPHRYTDALP
jgi:hypothetical protein